MSLNMNDNDLRSNRVKKGPHKWMQRSIFRTVGMTQAEIERPLIGVVSSWTNLFPGHTHLDKLAQAVSDGVHMAGGTPVIFNTIALCDGIAMNSTGMRYSLPSRELIADCVETMVEGHGFDAIVLVPACDKIIPGMMIAALRLNIPAIVITGGPAIVGYHKGKRFNNQFADLGGLSRKVVLGEAEMDELYELENQGFNGCTVGSCSCMATANSMGCMSEMLGLGVPGNGTVPAVYSERTRMAKFAGMKIMELLENDIKPLDVITKQSFENAIALDMMLGCSTNTALHLPALADAAGMTLDLDDFDRISRKVPQIVKLAPAGTLQIEDLFRAGGLAAVIKEGIDAGMIDGTQRSVIGQTIGELVADAEVYDRDVIRTIENAHSPEGGLFVLKGNLAPDGSVIKVGGVAPEMLTHSGAAKVFNSEMEAFEGLTTGKVEHGDVMIIRYEGPKGGPGIQEMLALTTALANYGFDKDVALVTDGRFSGGSVGGVIGHVCPEAAAGGLIGLVEDGDIISYDVYARTINLLVDDEEIAKRRAAYIAPPPKAKKGWLSRYGQLAQPATRGAVIKGDSEL